MWHVRGFEHFLAGIYDFLTLPILKERIEKQRVQITRVLKDTIDVFRIRYHLRTYTGVITERQCDNYANLGIPEILEYSEPIY